MAARPSEARQPVVDGLLVMAGPEPATSAG
jgi:hypothetical protein